MAYVTAIQIINVINHVLYVVKILSFKTIDTNLADLAHLVHQEKILAHKIMDIKLECIDATEMNTTVRNNVK